MTRTRILFFGSDFISTKSLKAIYEAKNKAGQNLCSRIGIVCPPPQRTGRGLRNVTNSPILDFARKHEIECFTAPAKRKAELKEWCLPQNLSDSFDIGVVVSFGYFLPSELIRSFKYGAINLHPSLLPMYRGAAPIQHALINGDGETGISIINVDDSAFDVGDILFQVKEQIRPEDTFLSLADRLGDIGAEHLVNVLQDFEVVEAQKWPQKTKSNVGVLRAPKIKPRDSNIRWGEQTAKQAVDLWRGIGEQIGIFSGYGGKRVRLRSISPVSAAEFRQIPAKSVPGHIHLERVHKKNRIAIKCMEGWIECTSFQFDGRKIIDANSFANGFLKKDPLLNYFETLE
mmetsp:Transcript_19985/g.25951  ORF Transcript_19985/g.25951 Transcript_19985/m.25951 type:complete len:344 (+) Transcript_19985:108-1139(+)